MGTYVLRGRGQDTELTGRLVIQPDTMLLKLDQIACVVDTSVPLDRGRYMRWSCGAIDQVVDFGITVDRRDPINGARWGGSTETENIVKGACKESMRDPTTGAPVCTQYVMETVRGLSGTGGKLCWTKGCRRLGPWPP